MFKKKSQGWYSREKNKSQSITSRYLVTLSPDIYIPSIENKEQEKINAHQAIKDYVKDGNGYLSNVGDYTVRFDREIIIEPYI